MVRVAMAGTANTAGDQNFTVESTMEFAPTDGNFPTTRISGRDESKETA